MAPRRQPATADGDTAWHQFRLAGLRLVRSGELTTKAVGARCGLTYAQARRFIFLRGDLGRIGPSPFFFLEEENLRAKYPVINATMVLGLSQDTLSRVCASFFNEMSSDRQAAARDHFNSSLSPGRSWVDGLLSRHKD